MQAAPIIKDRIQQYWDKSAQTYDQSYGHGLRSDVEKQLWLDLLKRNVEKGKGEKVLDVGSGTGFLSLLLAELGYSVTGIDLSASMRRQAAVKAVQKGFSIDFIPGDAEQPPFAEKSVDVIISRHVVWTLPNPVEALSCWHQLLKPGGVVLIIDGVWTPRSVRGYLRHSLADGIRLMRGKFNHLFWRKKYAAKGELPFFGGAEPETVIELMEKVGFKNVWHDRMEHILHHERYNGPLEYRITHGTNRRYLIGGQV